MTELRCILTGPGRVGCQLLDLLASHEEALRQRYGVALRLVGVADTSGIAASSSGLDTRAVAALKRAKRGVSELPRFGRSGVEALSLVQQAEADLLLEATPTSMLDGQPGLDLVRAALKRGLHVVLASKGPLVVAFEELAALSDQTEPTRPTLRFSATVGASLPSVSVGQRDLVGARILRIEAILNATTQVILGKMGQGYSYEAALAEAQRLGILEPDPSLDVEGWDAAGKLVILANAVLRRPTTLSEVSVTGITQVSAADAERAAKAGQRLSLLATAEASPGGSDYRLAVAPSLLPPDHPLAHLALDEMAVVYHTDICGRITVAAARQGPVSTAAAMLRDTIEIATPRHSRPRS